MTTPLDILGRLLMELPKILDSLGAVLERTGQATRRMSGRPSQIPPSRREPDQYIHKHFDAGTAKPRRCFYCGVLLTAANEKEHCPAVPV